MLTKEWALEFVQEWIEAWNAHDLERILSHYIDDFEMSSPLIVERAGRADGVLKGKANVAAYWKPSMSLDPPLRFELIDVLVGPSQLTIYYRNVGRRVVAETLVFNASREAIRGCAQWSALEM